jgi:hypothetical protein
MLAHPLKMPREVSIRHEGSSDRLLERRFATTGHAAEFGYLRNEG